MTLPRITKHAYHRIKRGDENGRRTHASPREIQQLVTKPETLFHGRYTLAYSEPDDKSLVIITDRKRLVIVTLYDTSRFRSRLADMVARARAGAAVHFASWSTPTSHRESDASPLYLSRVKRKGKNSEEEIVCDIGHLFGIIENTYEPFESREFHELVVAACESTWAEGLITKLSFKYISVMIRRPRFVCQIPIWISYELLNHPRPA